MTDPYNQGYEAYQAGQHLWENPYWLHTDEDGCWHSWYDGYKAAEKEFLSEEN